MQLISIDHLDSWAQRSQQGLWIVSCGQPSSGGGEHEQVWRMGRGRGRAELNRHLVLGTLTRTWSHTDQRISLMRQDSGWNAAGPEFNRQGSIARMRIAALIACHWGTPRASSRYVSLSIKFAATSYFEKEQEIRRRIHCTLSYCNYSIFMMINSRTVANDAFRRLISHYHCTCLNCMPFHWNSPT